MRLTTTFGLATTVLLSACAVHSYPIETPLRPATEREESVQARFEYAIVDSASLTQFWEDGTTAVSSGELKIRMLNETAEDLAVVGSFAAEVEASRLRKQQRRAASGRAPAGPPTDEEHEDSGAKLGESEVTVAFEYWRAKNTSGPTPVVLVTPILGGGKELARTNCRDFVNAGLHVILVWRGTRVLHRKWPPELIEIFLRRAVASRRALLDWACTQDEIDSERLAAFGISMGGILTSVLVGAEPRLHSVVIALAGGDLGGIIEVSEENRLIKFREEQRKRLGIDPAQLKEQIRESLVSDPLHMAPYADPRQVLMLTTRFDPIVPPAFQEKLWEAFGRPRRYDIPSGHYTGILYLPYITSCIVDWYRRRLLEPSAP